MYKLAYIIGIAVLLLTETASGQIQRTEDSSVVRSKELRDERIENLRKAAEELIQAMNKSEFEKFADFTLPEVIDKSGGRERFVSIFRQTFDETNKSFDSVSIKPQDPGKLVEFENKLFGIVPFRIEGIIAQNKNIVVSLSSVVGVSRDNGSNLEICKRW